MKFSGLLVSCIFSGIVGLAYLIFDPLVRSLILKKMVLSTTSENFKMWEDPPINPHLKVLLNDCQKNSSCASKYFSM